MFKKLYRKLRKAYKWYFVLHEVDKQMKSSI